MKVVLGKKEYGILLNELKLYNPELLDKERLQKENDYLKEQLFKLSKDPRYKIYYP